MGLPSSIHIDVEAADTVANFDAKVVATAPNFDVARVGEAASLPGNGRLRCLHAYTIGKNVKYQQGYDPSGCTPNFEALFRKAGVPPGSYNETIAVGPLSDVSRPVVIHARSNSATLKMPAQMKLLEQRKLIK
jgi:hypothetical protein